MVNKLRTKRWSGWMVLSVALVSVLTLGACSQGVSKEEAARKDQEIVNLRSQVTDLQTQASTFQQDATYWKQLTALYEPVPMASMTDHRAFMLPSGAVLALHFDSMDLSKAQNLNWVALGVPGTFCKAEQARVEKQFGSGFTHFHDMENDVHGGKPGAKGVWFVHTAVRDFNSPMSGGNVKKGIDTNFMPTAAPAC
ncbi:MAG: hypothetical protein HY681_00160 [Chloroflexi bacterium]|nr:hypothetical protein [Chloroflexota bacterium]